MAQIKTSIALQSVHHIALICSDYEKSKAFYTEVLGLNILAEHYRTDRNSYKLDLGLQDHYVLELFSFENPPVRPSHPEAAGLRHLAFSVVDIDETRASILQKQIPCEDIRIDPYTQKRFFFFADPDGLPIEIYEQ